MTVERIGDATLYLGDCLEILPTLDKVDAVVTDPPYGISLVPQRGKTESIANDGRDEATALWGSVVPMLNELCKEDTAHLFWTRWSETWTKELLAGTYKVKSCVVWGKNNFGIGYYTRPQHEFAWYCHKGKPPVKENPVSDLWLVPKIQAPIHSCEKPVGLLERAISLCTYEQGAVVLDPFMGSGSCGIAAANLGRKFIGIEIEPKYFDIACERITAAYAQGRLFE